MVNNYKELYVMLDGLKVGTLFDDNGIIKFSYNIPFKTKGIEISPIKLLTSETKPLSTNNEFPEIYYGLPGVIRDSLPDTNGELVMNKFFEVQGLNPFDVSVLQRLAFIGNRGMGALEYEPKEIHEQTLTKAFEIGELYKKNKEIHLKDKVIKIDELMSILINSSSPVGGAKEKILICFNKNTKEFINCNYSKEKEPVGFEPYLLKFDSTLNYKEDTKVEFVYMKLAEACGIKVMPSELIDDGNMLHFITKRFDRFDGKKLHTATASALLHKPHVKNSISYEELLSLTFKITRDINDIKRLLKQILFNILFAVNDDHSKNFSFIMDSCGNWSLSPAYDLIYGLGVGSLRHKTTINGKNKNFIIADFYSLGKSYDFSDDLLNNIIATVINAYQDNMKELVNSVFLSRSKKDGIRLEIEERIKIFLANS